MQIFVPNFNSFLKSLKKVKKLKKRTLLVLFRNKYDGLPSIFKTVILVDLKDNRLCCNIFLGSRCTHCIRSSHHYKFEESKWKNRTFWYCSFKINAVECSFCHTCLSLILTVSWKAFSIRFDCWKFKFMVKKLAKKFRSLTVFFVSSFQEQIWWSAPNIPNCSFSVYEQDLAELADLKLVHWPYQEQSLPQI